MSLPSLILRRWYVALPLVLVTIGVALLIERQATPSFRADGVVMIFSPEVDPRRSALQGIDIAEAARLAGSDDVKQEALEAGGSDDYSVTPIGPRSIQVLIPARDLRRSTTTAEVVLRRLEAAIQRQQVESGRPVDEQVRTRMLIDVPGGLPEATDGADQTLEPAAAEVIGTLVLGDPFDEASNPFSAADSARLLRTSVTSDAERQRIETSLGDGVSFDLRDGDRGSDMLRLTTYGPTEDAVLTGFDGLVQELSTELEHRQITAGVPVSQRRFLDILADPQQALDTSPTLRTSTAVVLLFGLVISGSVVAGVELRSRRIHRLSVLSPQERRADSPAGTDMGVEEMPVPANDHAR